MLQNLKILKSKYGIISGLFIYIQLKLRLFKCIYLSDAKHPIYYRKNTIDEYTIIEIFGEDCYNIKIPFEPKLIIDAGANIGISSVYFANKYPNSHIKSIEPEKNNFEYLLKNCNQYKNISSYNNAIWNNNTNIEIKDRGYGTRGFVVEEVSHQSISSFKAITIKDLLGENSYIDILKLDIEGSEKALFEKNYNQWLPLVRCIIIEFHDRILDGCSKTVYNVLSKYNFSEYKKAENVIFLNKDLINYSDSSSIIGE